MKLKTYVAKDLKEALSQVKKDLGPEAVILSTHSRNVPDNGSGGGRRQAVEVTAAADLNTLVDLEESREGTAALRNPGPSIQQIQEDLQELKGLLRGWLQQNGPPSWLLQHRELAILYRVLIKSRLDERVLLGWLQSLQKILDQGEHAPLTLKKAALGYLQDAITVINPWQTSSSRPHLWTFLGPTGVGKTTTIAKLAVRFALVENWRVGLISLDNQRLGAHDQLAAYGRIAGLPLLVAHDREDLVEAIQKLMEQDVILIDTPGRSPYAPELAAELQSWLGGLPDLKHHLVLNAAGQESHLAAVIHGYRVLPPTSYIVAKIDESSDFSGIFNLACRQRVPISYLTTGQRVPEDIELASREKLTNLLLRRTQPNNSQPNRRAFGLASCLRKV